MNKLHLFNPDNDLALASGQANFTPPKAAMALRNAGAALPLWYADNGDRVLVSGLNARWFDLITDTFDIKADIYNHSPEGLNPSPWGWSLAARHTFELNGFNQDVLPDTATINRLRELSHRRTASVLRKMIAPQLVFQIAPAAIEISAVDDLRKYLHDHPASIIKSPWSSSGRGLIDARRINAGEVLRRCEGTISRQGSVLIEPAFDRISDFAMLFECSDGHSRFVGYSLFDTDTSGSYNGNFIAPDSVILSRIGQNYPSERLIAVADTVNYALDTLIAPCYNGPLGVDMLLAAEPDGSILLDATVEVNLRMTMGRVAHVFTEKYLAEGSEGHFSVKPHQPGTMIADAPLFVENHRLKKGSVALTPPGGMFDFIVEVNG